MQNLFATKTIIFGAVTITGGTVIAWAVFAMMDIITEVWGKKKAINTFLRGTILVIFFVLIGAIVDLLPGVNGDGVASMFSLTSSVALRIAIASPIAFIIGNYVNTLIMHIMKTKSKDSDSNLGFTIRATLSTLVGQLLDNAIFFILAFSPIISWAHLPFQTWGNVFNLILWITIFETVIEGVFSPLTGLFVKYLKKKKLKEELPTQPNNLDIIDNEENN